MKIAAVIKAYAAKKKTTIMIRRESFWLRGKNE